MTLRIKRVIIPGSISIFLAVCLSSCMTEERACRSVRSMTCAADFFVATNGNDAWSGQLSSPNSTLTDGPFRNLERGRDALRNLATQDLGRGGALVVRGGFYALSQTFVLDSRDSGLSGGPVILQAFPGETVILGGGSILPAEAFGRVLDSNILARLDPAARDQVVQVHLPSRGIRELGRFPVKHDGGPAVPELFFKGQRLTLARWPNSGWTQIAKIIAAGSDYTGREPGIFEYSGDRPLRWNVEEGVWLEGYWAYDWNAEILQVKSIDPVKRQIALAAQAIYSLKQGNPTPRRYYAFNLIEELDRPGEYFIDRKTGVLYVWPPVPVAGSRILLSTLKGPVIRISNASNLVVRGFTIEATIGNGLEIRNGHQVFVQACEIRNSSEIGVLVDGGTSNQVEACDIHDTGKGGISLSGGDRKTLSPGAHEAVNNHIWRFSCHKLTYSNAIRLEGVGHRVAHNLIHDAPHQAIGVSGNDHLIEFNRVRDVCLETDDCGALYKGRNPSCRGNIIRYNFWHHIGNPMGHGNAAIYFDDGDGGDQVIGNVFYRCGDPGKGSFGTVFSHGGHDNLASNNIFIECKRALGSSPWPDARWLSVLKGNGKEGWNWADKLLKEVNITQPPYTTRYPELQGFLDSPTNRPRVNRARQNLLVNGGQLSSGAWQYSASDNWVTSSDPGFMNAAAGDFRLKPDSEVYARLPGFQPIPFEKIGLFTNALRPVLSPEIWYWAEKE